MSTYTELADLLSGVARGNKYTIVYCGEKPEFLLKAARQALPGLGTILRQDFFNERLTTRETICFFADLWGKKETAEEAASQMRLENALDLPIRKLTNAQQRKLCFAREILHSCHAYYIEDPLQSLNVQEEELVINWFESIGEKTGLLAVCFNEKDAARLPMPAYVFNGTTLKPLAKAPTQSHFVVDKISARKGDSVFLLNPGEIDYAESENGKTSISAQGENYICALTLDELEEKLARYGFYRSHRCCLVNMQKVHEIIKWTRNSYALRLDGTCKEIPLSKGRIEEMKSIYGF